MGRYYTNTINITRNSSIRSIPCTGMTVKHYHDPYMYRTDFCINSNKVYITTNTIRVKSSHAHARDTGVLNHFPESFSSV